MPEFLNGDFFLRLLFVLGIDLILSGDNAVVIALAARRLKGANRRKAILWGTVGAVALFLAVAWVQARRMGRTSKLSKTPRRPERG